MYSHRNEFPQAFGKLRFPVFARVRIQAPHLFAQNVFLQKGFLHVLVLCREGTWCWRCFASSHTHFLMCFPLCRGVNASTVWSSRNALAFTSWLVSQDHVHEPTGVEETRLWWRWRAVRQTGGLFCIVPLDERRVLPFFLGTPQFLGSLQKGKVAKRLTD